MSCYYSFAFKKSYKKITLNKYLKIYYLLTNFIKATEKLKPRMAILGLNPHCESTDNYNEDEK